MKAVLIKLGLLVFSTISLLLLGGVGIIYGLIKNLFGFPDKAFNISYIIDLLGNVVCPELFQDLLLLAPSSFPFGIAGQTISYVLKKNKELNNLSKKGLWLYNAIEKVDKGHFEKVKI